MGKLWISQNKGKKNSSPTFKGNKITRKPREKNWTRIPRDSQKPGILEMCSKARLGLRQFKGACPNHPMMLKKDQKIWEPTTHE